MSGATLICESTFPTVNFMTSKSKLIVFDENIVSKIRCAGKCEMHAGF